MYIQQIELCSGCTSFISLYELAEPMKIPAGSRIVAVAHYDNSIKNRYNPAPQKEVFWSEQSWDEMFIPWFEYTVYSKDLTKMAARK